MSFIFLVRSKTDYYLNQKNKYLLVTCDRQRMRRAFYFCIPTLYKPEYKTKNLKNRRLKSENIDFIVPVGFDFKVDIFENMLVRISMINPYFP